MCIRDSPDTARSGGLDLGYPEVLVRAGQNGFPRPERPGSGQSGLPGICLLPGGPVQRGPDSQKIRRRQGPGPLRIAQCRCLRGGGPQTRLAFRGLCLPQLFLHVDHVPHHLCAGHPWSRTTGQTGLVLHRHGHHGRSHPAQAHGPCGRYARHVTCLHRAAGLLCLRVFLRLCLVPAQRGCEGTGIHPGPGRALNRGPGRFSADSPCRFCFSSRKRSEPIS